MECVWVIILFLHWSLSGAQRFDLEGGGSVAAPGSDVTLPCSLKPRMSAVDMEVKWTRQDPGDKLVHHYKNKQDQTDKLDPSYINRTSLFIEKLQQGNTSLLLKKVQVSDGGLYRCRVDSDQWKDSVNVQLRIEATGGTPEISVLGTGVSGGVLLQCESRGWWPVPDLQWLNSEGAKLPAGVKESCEDVGGFYVRRSLTAHKSNTNTYICRVKLGEVKKEEQIDITDHLPKPDNTAAIAVSVTLILLSALVCVVVYFIRRDKLRKWLKEKQTADMCLKGEGEPRLHGVNFTDAQWKYVEHTLLTSEEVLEVFDLRKYDPSEECFLKLQKVVYACRKAQLSYCDLTEKSCDVLASVLRSNSRLRELDLSQNILWNSGVKKLCSGLESSDCKLEKLSLSNCSIREEGCAALCSALKKNPSHLRELNLDSNNPRDSGVKQLSDLLEDPHCKLEKLHLSYCMITKEGCDDLCSALKNNPSSHMRVLNLHNNKSVDSRLEKLSALLEYPHCKLEILDLTDCSITQEGCVALCSALKKNPSHLRELNLNHNKPGDSGVKQLSDLLEDPHCKLEKLDLSGCSITEQGCAALCSALKKNPAHLRELNLNNNKPGDSGVKQLSALLEDPHCTLEKLDLSSCSITEEGCAALCSALKKNPSSHLRELNLNNNKPGDSGVKQLSDLLEDQNYKLEKLELSKCSIREEGFDALCSALKKNPSHLRELNLNHNKPGDSGVKQLSALLEDPHCKLEKLDLSWCSITEEGCVALCSALKKNTSSHPRELNLDYNKSGLKTC
ncbi:ribonuclease inhibitor-like isoform X2 [Brachyhypopomus gauderio]|uniref:ribonuclease inhibitor-like isoform X2 n=1 Tax=Brachyhypopomus gauderio TaxID=698409 RepID=UPI004040F398